MAYTNIALTKFITQEKNDALPNSQGLNLVGVGPLKVDSSGVVSALTPSATTGYVLTSTGNTTDPTWQAPAGGGAPTGAKYWLSSTVGSSGLSAAIDLGTELTTGLMKATVSGASADPSTAVAGTDYYAPDYPTRLFDTSGSDNVIAMGKDFSASDFTGITDLVCIGSSMNIGTSDNSVLLGNEIFATGTLTGASNVIIGHRAGYGATSSGNVVLVGSYTGGVSNIDNSTCMGIFALLGAGTTGGVSGSLVAGNYSGSGIQGGMTDSVVLSPDLVSYIGGAYTYVDVVTVGADIIPSGSPRTITNAIAIGKGSRLSVDNSCSIGAPAQDMKVSVSGTVPTHTMHLFNGSTLGASLAIEGSASVPAAPTGGSVFHTNGSGQPSLTSSLSNSSGLIPTLNGALANGDIPYGVTASGFRFNKLTIGNTGEALTVSGGLPTWAPVANRSATFVLKTADASMPNAEVLSTMTTGLVKVTTGTGELDTAVAGTDYVAPATALTSIVSAGSQTGSLWVGSGTNTVSKVNPGSTGTVLTSTGTGTAPTWQAPSGLPTITTATACVKLTTWNGAAAWAGRTPYLIRTSTSNNVSLFPEPSTANLCRPTMITDQVFCPYNYRIIGGGDSYYVTEMGIPGFNATVTGQKIFYSLYYISGWSSNTANTEQAYYGMCDPEVLRTQSPTNLSAPGGCAFFIGGVPVNGTTLNYRDSVGNSNYSWAWANAMNFNAKIISIGYDTSTATISFWQHDAATGALLGSATKTASPNFQSLTNIVPMFNPCPGVPNAGLRMQVMTAGYPTISGYTNFYAM